MVVDDKSICEKLWADAFLEWKTTLDKSDFKSLRKVPTYEVLQKSLNAKSKIYKNRTIPKLMERIYPTIAQLNSFTRVLNTFS